MILNVDINRLKSKLSVYSLLYLAIGSSLAISHGDTTLVTPAIRTLFIYTQYVAILIVILCTSWRKVPKRSLLILLPTSMYYLFYLYDSEPFLSVPLNLLLILPLLLIALQPANNMRIVYVYFYRYAVIISLLGIIASISFIFNLGIPYEIVSYYNGENYYVNFHFSYLYWGGGDGLTFRLCGLFNEPGFFGTVNAILLINERIRLTKIGNMVLFIAGFFTFSAAFYALLAVYVIFISSKKMYIWIIILSIVCLVSHNMDYIRQNMPVFYRLIERFEYDKKEGKFEGDNRTEYNFEKQYAQITSNIHSFFWGFGTSAHTRINTNNGVDSYKVIIYQYGVLGFSLIYLLFFIIRIRDICYSRDALLLSLCLLLSIYQRPRIFIAVYFILYYGALDWIAFNVSKTSTCLKAKMYC